MRELHEPRPSLPSDVGRTLGGWIAGQTKIVAILCAVYSIGFAISGVPWWLAVGIVAGLLNFIPMLGAVIALFLALGVAYFGTSDIYPVAGALVTFVVAQALEGFWLTPRILGRRLRLPAIVVFLAILIGGFMFGPIGVVFAAPAVAILMVFWRHARRA